MYRMLLYHVLVLRNSAKRKKESSVTDTSTDLTEISRHSNSYIYVYMGLMYGKDKVVPVQGRYMVGDKAQIIEFLH